MTDAAALPATDTITCLCGHVATPYIDHGRRLYARGAGITATLYGCPSCGHKSFAPEPAPSDLNHIYSSAYFNDAAERQLYVDRYAAPRFDMADDLGGALEQFAGPRARVHEFGCGTGLTVHHLRRMGFRASGSDWSKEATSFGKEMGNAYVMHEGPNKPAQISKLDAALSNHVIEHVSDPIGFLRDMGSNLKEDGVLVLRCPNGDGAIARRMGMLFDPLFYYPQHIHYFSARSLAACARAAGLKVISLTSTSRFTPELREHIFPPTFGDNTDRFATAMAAFESEELQLVAALPSHPAPAIEIVGRSPAPAAPAVDAWDSHEGFHQGGPWSYDLLHDTFEGACPMVWSPEHSYWYFGRCYISDHWLAHYGTEYRPGLSFTAPEAGDYELEIVAGLRHAWLPELRLILDARRARSAHWVESVVPRTFVRRATLAAGEKYTVAVENPHPTEQKVVVLVRARRL